MFQYIYFSKKKKNIEASLMELRMYVILKRFRTSPAPVRGCDAGCELSARKIKMEERKNAKKKKKLKSLFLSPLFQTQKQRKKKKGFTFS